MTAAQQHQPYGGGPHGQYPSQMMAQGYVPQGGAVQVDAYGQPIKQWPVGAYAYQVPPPAQQQQQQQQYQYQYQYQPNGQVQDGNSPPVPSAGVRNGSPQQAQPAEMASGDVLGSERNRAELGGAGQR